MQKPLKQKESQTEVLFLFLQTITVIGGAPCSASSNKRNKPLYIITGGIVYYVDKGTVKNEVKHRLQNRLFKNEGCYDKGACGGT